MVGQVGCDSMEVQVGTNITPSGVTYWSPSILNNTASLPNYGVGDLQLRNIPGQDYLSAEVWDGGVGFDWQHNYFVIQECNIVLIQHTEGYSRILISMGYLSQVNRESPDRKLKQEAEHLI